MAEIVKSDETFVRREVSRAEALDIFADQQFKVELINELPEDAVITTYPSDRSPTCAAVPICPARARWVRSTTKVAGRLLAR